MTTSSDILHIARIEMTEFTFKQNVGDDIYIYIYIAPWFLDFGMS